MNDVVEGVASMLARTLGEHTTLQLQLGDPPVVVVVDRHQLEQILLNLAINARDAMPDGGVLTIISERAVGGGTASADEVVLRVLDTGEGMLPEVVARGFKPFFTTKDRAQGSGLGLATVHGIVRLCGGDISLESELGGPLSLCAYRPRRDLSLHWVQKDHAAWVAEKASCSSRTRNPCGESRPGSWARTATRWLLPGRYGGP